MKILALVLFIIGIFYALFPHTIHVSYGLSFGLSHTYHVIIGAIAIILGFFTWRK